MENKLFSAYILDNLHLKNRVVMAPMTRNRSLGNVPNDLMATYYAQRASAGLIITEGTAPSPNALGYANIPGIFTPEQVEAWKNTTSAVHQKGGKIFLQLMHTGRMGHPEHLPEGAELIAPSAIAAVGKAIKNTQRTSTKSIPRAMTTEDIKHTINEFSLAAIHATEADFDGVELHGANEHIIEQFLSPVSNERTDEYGGSIENRCRFVLELVQHVVDVIGFDKVGIRLSPYGMNSWLDDEITYATYDYLTRELDKISPAYIHYLDHSTIGGNEVPQSMKELIRMNFSKTILLTGGFDREKAKQILQEGLVDLIGFGRPFIGNPDLVERMQNNYPINSDIDPTTLYTLGAKGYTDYLSYNP